MSSSSCTLYSTDSSYYSMIARLGLYEKGVPFSITNIDIHVALDQLKPAYAKIQPNMTVPTLQYAETVLTSSLDILTFANSHFSGPQLVPHNPTAVTEMNAMLDLHYAFSIEDLTMGQLLQKSPLVKYMLKHDINRAIRHCLRFSKTNPELADAYSKKIALNQFRIKNILDNKNNFAEKIKQVDIILDKLEANLQQQDFIASTEYTLADVVWTCFLARLFFIQQQNRIQSRPKLFAYWQRMSQRPSFKKANIWCKMRPSKIFYILLSLFLR